MSQPPTSTEGAITEGAMQKRIIYYLRLQFPNVVFFANPFSELKLKGPPRYKAKVLAGMKDQGWEKDIPDIHIAHKGRGYAGLSLELKRSIKEMPTYDMPRKKCLQIINKGANGMFSDKVNHLRGQALKLHRLNQAGNLALFECDERNIIDIIKWYLSISVGYDMKPSVKTEFKMRNERGKYEAVKIWALDKCK